MPIPDGPFVFVSYSSKDASFVHSEIKRVEGQGYKVWYDQGELLPARFWAEEIRSAIAACACFAVFISEDSVLSDNVCDEIDQALKANKPFIAIYWDNVELPPALQKPVRSRQTLDRYALHLSNYQELLRKALSEHIRVNWRQGIAMDTKVEYATVISAPRPETLPKVLFFCLLLLAAFFLFFAFVMSVTPFIVSARPNDIINNRPMSIMAAVTLVVLSFVLIGLAFVVFRMYLRRKHD
jgi:hypothetical protein